MKDDTVHAIRTVRASCRITSELAQMDRGENMAIGILIRRVTKHGVDARVLLPLIVELRSIAVRQSGYISGETFFNLDRPEECVVIGRWTSLDHWRQFEKNKRRAELIEKIEEHLEGKAEYNVYGIGLW